MRTIYEDQSIEVVLLVHVSNAFNSINRNAFLHNITIICPPLARYVRNCIMLTHDYLLLVGVKSNQEGITQGDPTAMAIYAIAIIPLVLMLVEEASQVDNTRKTAAYAHDLATAGTIVRLRNWWDTLTRLRPKFRYFSEGKQYAQPIISVCKTWCGKVSLFLYKHNETNIKIITEGQRHLGALLVPKH